MMNPSIKLISVNIEGDRHLDRLIPFLKNENADVICFQEVLEKDIETLQQKLTMHGEFTPMVYIQDTTEDNIAGNNILGLLTLTKHHIEKCSSEFYVKNSIGDELPIYDESNTRANRKILTTEITKDNTTYKIINTHFTWTTGGEATQKQHEHLDTLFQLLDNHQEFILCGDFNAPRGRAVWERIAKRYTDNIPKDVITTLDQNLHKVKGLQYVVDGMFSTKQYSVTDVKVIDGVSDHKAIVGTVHMSS